FLLGDAAHVHSPVGGQGMNTGLLDAHNLAWKLAAVARGAAGDRLLDSYEAERRPFAQRLVRTTDRLFDLIVNPNPIWQRVRGRLLPALLKLVAGQLRRGSSRGPQSTRRAPVLPTILFGLVSQTGLGYRTSSLSWGRVGRIQGGDRLPFVPQIDGSNFDALKDARPQLHVYGTAVPALLAWAHSRPEIDLKVFPASAKARAAGLQAGAVYLVRPDGYISAALMQFDAGVLEQVLNDRWAWRATATDHT
ncbi:MAG: FAD-dependent monooxygenase, partial [Roseiflexaceae bacterium]|nr:FAD-dependent monooxygenase [Roseiflexaceae bacterium]